MTGFQVLSRTRAVGPEVVQAFRQLPVANVSDCMSRLFAAGPRIRPMHAGGAMAGPALTVRTRPGDNFMVHKALHMAQAGDVVVVDAEGDLSNALVGEMMISHAIHKRLAGLVVNGAIRDSAFVRNQSFPVYAAGITHRGPYKDGPGELNVPIGIGGMVVTPGDLVLGDDDGVICVPYADAGVVLEKTRQKQAMEQKLLAQIVEGTYSEEWIDAALKRLNCDLAPSKNAP